MVATSFNCLILSTFSVFRKRHHKEYVKWGEDKFPVKCSILFTMPLGLNNNLKIKNECDDNSTEMTAMTSTNHWSICTVTM